MDYEIWKDIPITNGTYQISSNKVIRKGSKIIKHQLIKSKPAAVNLNVDGFLIYRSVESLFYDAFIAEKNIFCGQFFTIPDYESYEMNKENVIRRKSDVLKSGRIREALELRQHCVRGSLRVNMRGDKLLVKKLHDLTFNNIPLRTEKKEIDDFKPSNRVTNSVQRKILEFKEFRKNNYDRYV